MKSKKAQKIAYFAYDHEGSEYFTFERGYRQELGFTGPDDEARREFVKTLKSRGYELRPATDLLDPDSIAPTTSTIKVTPRWAMQTEPEKRRAFVLTKYNYGTGPISWDREKKLAELPTSEERQKAWKEEHEKIGGVQVNEVKDHLLSVHWSCGHATIEAVVPHTDVDKLVHSALERPCPECFAKQAKEDRVARLKAKWGDKWADFA